MTDRKRESIDAAKAAILKHLALADSATREFAHLMTACGLQYGEMVDGLPHSRVLDRALQELRKAGKVACGPRRAWRLL
jgi:hypothetical protein